MTIKQILEYELIKTDKFVLTFSHILIILVILLGTRLIIGMINRIFSRQQKRRGFDPGRGHAILQIVKYVLWISAIFLALETVSIKITFLLAGSAALLVGIGLGLQQIFQDILSGVALLFEGSLRVNDIVQIENDIIGRVLEIGLRTSKIKTRDNIVMIVPNSKFITDNVINWSHMESKTRFSVKVGVAYGTDVERVREILLDCAKKHENVTDSPPAFVRFNDFGESSLDFELYFWTNESFWVENIKSDLRFMINRAFKENKITIPFPQRDVHFYPKNS